MTTIHPQATHHPMRLPVLAALLVALGILAVIAVLGLQSDATADRAGAVTDTTQITTGSNDRPATSDWDVLCFKPAYRDAAPCTRGAAPAGGTIGGRLP